MVVDHNSTVRDSQVWRDQWQTSFQLGTYVHAALCLFPPEEVYGAMVNAAMFRNAPRVRKDGLPRAWHSAMDYLLRHGNRNLEAALRCSVVSLRGAWLLHPYLTSAIAVEPSSSADYNRRV